MYTKVIVIDDRPGADFTPDFKMGEEVHISEVPEELAKRFEIFGLDDIDRYCIVQEYPFNICGDGKQSPTIWFKKRFAPISEIDETEMDRDYKRSDISIGIQAVLNGKVKFSSFSANKKIGKSEFFRRILLHFKSHFTK